MDTIVDQASDALTRLWQLRAADHAALPAAACRGDLAGLVLDVAQRTACATETGRERERARLAELDDSSTSRDTGRLLDGAQREAMLDWLASTLTILAPYRRRALGELERDATHADIAALLADEGFREQLVDHVNNGDEVRLWLADDGLLAETVTPRSTSDRPQQPRPQLLRIYYAVEVVDEELFAFAVHSSGTRRAGLAVGELGWNGGSVSMNSLRVGLAALRALTRPVLPWPEPAVGYLGRDDAGGLEAARSRTREIIATLPHRAHELLGPRICR